MTQPTFSQLRALLGGGPGINAEAMSERMLTLLAVIASGQNPDGTAFSPPAAASLPLTVSNNATAFWNAVAVGVAGKSTAASLYALRNWFIFGNASAATTLTVEVSSDTATWRASSITAVLAGAGDFVIDCRAIFGASFVRLSSSAAATITAGYMGNY